MAYDYNKLVEDWTNTLRETLGDGPWIDRNPQKESEPNEVPSVVLENINLKKQNTGLQNALLESQNERKELKRQNERLKSALKSIKSTVTYIKDEELT